MTENEIYLKIALLEMVIQFAYNYTNTGDNKEHLYHGGLSALESAFAVCELENDVLTEKVTNQLNELYSELEKINKEENIMDDIYDNYDKERARKDGLKYAIEEIEDLLGELEYTICESQGAMLDLYARMEEANILREVLNYLDPNHKVDIAKLSVKAYNKLYKQQKYEEIEKEELLLQYLKKYNLPDLRKENKDEIK